MSRYISNKIKKNVLQKQEYKCAKIKDYKCLLWICNNGIFDDAGYEFDHIEEFSITKNNLEDNVQALCPNCHAVKTKRFLQNKNIFTTIELNNGAGLMDIDICSKKKRKII